MTRFNHIDSPQALPGCCTLCRKAVDPNGFVDTSLELDFEGAVIVCYSCVRAMHDVFSLDANARHLINEDAVANVNHLLEVVQGMKEDYEAQLNALIAHVSGLDASFSKSYKLLAEAAEVRERIIREAADRANESFGLVELGVDSDELGIKS